MIPINSLRLALAVIGLAAVSSSAVAQSSDPDVAAAIYHAAGNTTQVSTDIVVTQPTSDTVWYAQSKVSISWTGTKPTDFAFQIINKDSSVRASGMTLLADAKTTDGTATSRIGKIEPGTYFVRLYDPTDISKQIALSQDFTIRAKSDMPSNTQGGAVNGNSTVSSTTTAASTVTTTTTTDADGTVHQVVNSGTAANPDVKTQVSASSSTNAAVSQREASVVLAVLVGLTVAVIAW